MEQVAILTPDSKGRITLGKMAEGISSFHVIYDEQNGKIILKPHTKIPLKERWLYDNKSAIKQLSQGIKDSEKGRIRSKGDFSKYLDSDDE